MDARTPLQCMNAVNKEGEALSWVGESVCLKKTLIEGVSLGLYKNGGRYSQSRQDITPLGSERIVEMILGSMSRWRRLCLRMSKEIGKARRRNHRHPVR